MMAIARYVLVQLAAVTLTITAAMHAAGLLPMQVAKPAPGRALGPAPS